jgi:hypothetical protein
MVAPFLFSLVRYPRNAAPHAPNHLHTVASAEYFTVNGLANRFQLPVVQLYSDFNAVLIADLMLHSIASHAAA